jgi:hypothetical protein
MIYCQQKNKTLSINYYQQKDNILFKPWDKPQGACGVI